MALELPHKTDLPNSSTDQHRYYAEAIFNGFEFVLYSRQKRKREEQIKS